MIGMDSPLGCVFFRFLRKLFQGRRIIVTPGMVEQGEKEDELNYAFGTQMVSAADVVILVGPRHTRPIYEGLVDSGFSRTEIYVVNNLDDASAMLRKLGSPGDTVLFENDLPDNYDE